MDILPIIFAFSGGSIADSYHTFGKNHAFSYQIVRQNLSIFSSTIAQI